MNIRLDDMDTGKFIRVQQCDEALVMITVGVKDSHSACITLKADQAKAFFSLLT